MDAKTTITLSITLDEVNTVLGGLGELPAKLSFPLINKIQTQATEQINAAETPEATEVQS